MGKDFKRLDMATRNDFEKKKRERERQARIRQKRNRTILTAVIVAIAVIAAIASIVSCNSKNNNQEYVPENVNDNLTTTAAPTAVPSAGTANLPPASEENDLLEIIENSTATKYAYLTFDDGPTEKITPKILDILRRYDIKATFFQVGSYVKKLPDVTARVHEEGHLIASHSLTHNYDKLYANESNFKSEIEDTNELIKNVIGEEPFKLFRFPGGSYKAGSYGDEKQEYKKTLADLDYYYIDWNALNGDAEGATKDADGLFEYFKKNLPKDDNENLVILMHDASTKQATVDALDNIIDYLFENGYSFHRLDDVPYAEVSVSEKTVSNEE